MSPASAWLITAALWIGCLRPGPWWLAPAAAAALLLTARVPGRARLVVAAIALAAAGAGLAGGRGAIVDAGLLPAAAESAAHVTVEGTVVSEPRASVYGAWTVVRVDAVDGRRTRERALLRGPGLDALPQLGERFTLAGTVRPLEHDGFGTYLRAQYARTALDADRPVAVTRPAPPLVRATTVARERLRDAAGRHLPQDRAGLLTGLVTGDTSRLPPARADQLDDAGLAHLVAVSGANVALLLAGVTALARAARVGARGRRWLAAVAVVWFVLLVRAEPSVLRAAVMAGLVLLAGLVGRRQEPARTLPVAAALLLLADPGIAGQLGFVLSVLATAGVLVVAPALVSRLPGPPPLRVVLATTLGAQLGVAPVLIRVEGGVPLAAVPANLVAVPAAAVASVIGAVAALMAQVSVPAAGVVAALAEPAVAAVLWAGAFFSGPHTMPTDLVLLAGIALAAVTVLRGRRTPRVALVAVVAIVTVIALPRIRAPTAVTQLALTAFDVGQGDALLVEAPPAARMLVDGGPGPRDALRHLRGRGVRRLDAVALSHPHADHSGGLPAVLAAMPVGALLVGPDPPWLLADPAPSALETYRTAEAEGVPVVPVAAGERFRLGAATVEVLSPPADGSLGDEPNDNSLVLRVSGPGGSLLLTGDAEVAAQTRLLARPDRLRATVLKVPHHGGATNADGFFAAVGATIAVVSVGEGNDYGHPAPSVLAALSGVDLRRTDTDGSVRVTPATARAPPRAAGRRRARP